MTKQKEQLIQHTHQDWIITRLNSQAKNPKFRQFFTKYKTK